MKLAMISCSAYADAWGPFLALLNKFWPDHPPVTVLTDTLPDDYEPMEGALYFAAGQVSWCEVLGAYARTQTEPFILAQEDFFLTANVKAELIAAAAAQLGPLVGGVRVYPCPGGSIPLESDARVGIAGKSYRVSCQATVWRPEFLVELLTAIGPGSAAHFEIEGSRQCNKTMLAWMRNCEPWPIEYLCSAIQRGAWMADAKRICDLHGIQVDWSKRQMQEAVTA